MNTTDYNTKLKKSEIEKKKARKITVDEIINTYLTGQILSLPHLEYIMERQLLKENSDFEFTCCEFNDNIYWKMVQYVAEKKLPFFDNRKTSLGKIIFKSIANEYAHIIADYCGTFNSFAPELEHVLKNNIIQVGGTLSITLIKRMPKQKKNHYKRFCKIRKQEKGVTQTEHALNVMTEQYPNYETIKVHPYKNMILYIIQRVK